MHYASYLVKIQYWQKILPKKSLIKKTSRKIYQPMCEADSLQKRQHSSRKSGIPSEVVWQIQRNPVLNKFGKWETWKGMLFPDY